MTKVVALNNQKFELVSTTEKIFNSPVVTKVESSELLNFLIDNVTKLLHDLGQKVESDSLLQLSASLQESLTTEFKWITISEIPEIFKQGRRGDFGEFYGVNLNTIEVWIRSYYEHKRAEIVKRNSTKSEAPVISEEETKKRNDKAVQNALIEIVSDYKQKKSINPCFMFLYNYLFDNGHLPKQTPEYVKEIKERAIKIVEERMKHDRVTKGIKIIESHKAKKLPGVCRELVLEDWVKKQIT